MTSLQTIVRNKLLEAIRSVNPPGRWKILVVDEHSKKLLGAVLKEFDVLQENVTLIESITNNRDPQPGFEAMYLLMPTSQNIERVVKDFSGNTPQYAAAHLHFIDGLPEPLFQRLTSSSAEPHLKDLRELFINFHPLEAQLFSAAEPGMFFSIYAPPRSETSFRAARDRLEEDMRFTSKIITNLCIALNEFPYIRFYIPPNHPPLGPLRPHQQTRPPPPPEPSSRWRTNLARGSESRAFEEADTAYVTKLLAFMVQSNLEEHKKANPEFAVQKPGDIQRARSTLIVTDRSMDMLAPFLHEFTYQAMANDLLPIENGTKYTYKFQSAVGAYEDKTAILNDQDAVWTEVRHMHMRETIDKLMSDFNKFLQDNAVFNGEGAVDLNDMKMMLANLPQYQDQREKFSLHLNMAEECMGIFERDKLTPLANVEQCCSTGVTTEGKSPKSLVEDMVLLLDSRDVINVNKVRIIALYIQYRDGVPDEDRRRLYQHARLSLAEQDAVNALLHLGVKIGRGPNDKDSKKKLKQKSSGEEEYDLSRYKPALRIMLEDQVNNKLEAPLFPYVKESPGSITTAATNLRNQQAQQQQSTSLRSQKPAWHRAAKPAAQAENRQRLLVFVAGGVTYSEIREAYQLSNTLNKDIYIGSTHVVTPRQFVDDLKVLELGGVGSRHLPQGVKERTGGQRSFQDYYDEKYYTKDAPPPPRPPPAPTPGGRDSVKKIFKRDDHDLPSAPPPLQSSHSYSGSVSSAGKEEKKKKRGLFHF